MDLDNVKKESSIVPEEAVSPDAFVPQYDVTSKERYVDSAKSEFDRVLDELRRISEETLSWDVLRLTRKHFGDREEDNLRKFETFMGAFIVNAAVRLYDQGLGGVALERLEQAKTVLEAKAKLALEVEAIRVKTEEDVLDLTDMLGLFGETSE